MSPTAIVVRGAREHNLRDISLEIPRERLVVITGLSGSGKSSLAFDTIYAEGQRRYIESLSAYARQFLGVMEKPDVDAIEGLSPAISIEQKTVSRNPRSTVGTVTEIYDYLRLLYARVGTPYCPSCDLPIQRQPATRIVKQLLKMEEGTRIQVLAPLVRGRKGEFRDVFDRARRKGFVRALVNGRVYDLREIPRLSRYENHDIGIIVDRLVIREEDRVRLSDSVETALRAADGVVQVLERRGSRDISHLFSEHYACADCGTSFPELEPRVFSFNSPHGACVECGGLGTTKEVEGALLVRGPSLSILEGALLPWGEPGGHLRGSVIAGTGRGVRIRSARALAGSARRRPRRAPPRFGRHEDPLPLQRREDEGSLRGLLGRGRGQHRAPLPRDELRARALATRPVHVQPDVRGLRGCAAGALRAGGAYRGCAGQQRGGPSHRRDPGLHAVAAGHRGDASRRLGARSRGTAPRRGRGTHSA